MQLAPALAATQRDASSLRAALAVIVDESAYAHVRSDAFAALVALVDVPAEITAEQREQLEAVAAKRATGAADDVAQASKLLAALAHAQSSSNQSEQDLKKRKTDSN